MVSLMLSHSGNTAKAVFQDFHNSQQRPDEKVRLVQTKLIMSDIKSLETCNDFYPSCLNLKINAYRLPA